MLNLRSITAISSSLIIAASLATAAPLKVKMFTGNTCPTYGKTTDGEKVIGATIGALLLPIVVEVGVKSLAAAIATAAKGKAQIALARAPANLFSVSSENNDAIPLAIKFHNDAKCLTIIAFEGNGTGSTIEKPNQNTGTTWQFFEESVSDEYDKSSPSLAKFLGSTYGLEKQPVFYMELRRAYPAAQRNSRQTHWLYQPVAFYAPQVTAPNADKSALILSVSSTGATPSTLAQWEYDLTPYYAPQKTVFLNNKGRGYRMGDPKFANIEPEFDVRSLRIPSANAETLALLAELKGIDGATAAQNLQERVASAAAAAQKNYDSELVTDPNFPPSDGDEQELTKADYMAYLAKRTDALIRSTELSAAYYDVAPSNQDSSVGVSREGLEAKRKLHEKHLAMATILKDMQVKRQSLATEAAQKLISDDAKTKRDSRRKAIVAQLIAGAMVVDFEARVVLTNEPNVFLLKLAEVLGVKSETIANTLSDVVLDRTTNDDRVLELQAKTTALTTALTKISEFRVAQIAAQLPDATDAIQIQAQIDLLEARAECQVVALKGHTISECASLPLSVD